MDEQTVIARLGALRAPEVEPSRERAVAAITATLREPRPARMAPSRPRPSRRRLLVPALAIACLAAAIVAVTSIGGGPSGPTTPAYGAELVRFARSTPLLLLEEPGWRVSDVIEDASGGGQMNFAQGDGKAPARAAELNWRGGPLGSWLHDRAGSSDLRTTAPVLGTTAHVFRYEGGRPGDRDFTALWAEAGRVLEFRTVAADLAAFEQRLGALRQVGSQRWLEAMPANVIKAADHGGVVAGMLQGISLPAGFRASQIPGAGITTDRYQLGAAVAGTVACRWFAQWGEDLGRGDAGGAGEAERALAGATGWPVLNSMEAEGAYPQVLDELAAEMPSRAGDPRPFLGDVDSGLGCTEKGVRLNRAGPAVASP